jgi:hypothetical protein
MAKSASRVPRIIQMLVRIRAALPPYCPLNNSASLRNISSDLTELSFEFDQAGTIIDCVGTIKDGGNVDYDYAGSGLARLYERARRQLASRQISATVLQFPNGERLAKCVA